MTPSREERIEAAVMKIATNMATLIEAGQNRQRMLNEHHEILFGNGKPGLKERMQSAESNNSEMRTSITDIRSFCGKTHKQGSTWGRIWPPAVSTIMAAVILAVLAFSLRLWTMHPSETVKAAAPITNAPK